MRNYHSKGKVKPVYLLPRATILKDYLVSDRRPTWKAYVSFSDAIRKYRNRIVHDVALGSVVVAGKFHMVPRKERIEDYASLHGVPER